MSVKPGVYVGWMQGFFSLQTLNTSISQVVFTSLTGVCVAAVSRRAGALVKQHCPAPIAAGRRRWTAITCTLRRERRAASGRRGIAAGQDWIRRADGDGQRCTGDSSTLQILWEHTHTHIWTISVHLKSMIYRDINITDAVKYMYKIMVQRQGWSGTHYQPWSLAHFSSWLTIAITII